MSIAEAIFNATDASGSGTTSAPSLVAQFKKMDTSGSGTLSQQQWLDGLHNLGYTDDARAQTAFGKLDKSGGGMPLSSLNAIVQDATQGGSVTKAAFVDATKKAVA